MFVVLWDNDGVLVETEGLYFDSSRRVLADWGIELTREQFQEISLRQGRSTLELAMAKGARPDQLDDMRTRRDQLFADLLHAKSPLIPGAREAIDRLRGRVRQGIVTSSRRWHFDVAHRQTGIPALMDFVLTREDYDRSKPDPEPYLAALERFEIDPAQCLVVEDSERGLRAAVAAGLDCVIIQNPWSDAGDFRSAARVLSDVTQVPDEVFSRLGIGDS